MVSDIRSEGREVKHDGALAPVGAIRGIVRDLSQEVVIRPAKLDVDPTSVGGGHVDQILRVLRVKELASPLQHVVCHGDGEGELHGVAVKIVIPLGGLPRPEPADQDVVVVACDGPLSERLVGIACVEVGIRPDVEEDALCDFVRRLEVFAAV